MKTSPFFLPVVTGTTVMTTSKPTWLRATPLGQCVALALSLALTVGDYFLWQLFAAFVSFFTLGTGAGHSNEDLLLEACFFALHVGLLSWLFWRRTRYLTWWAWTLNVGASIGLFMCFVVYPWYCAPADPTYQTYLFTRGARRYKITLEQPAHVFDLSAVTPPQNGSTISLLMGAYQVRSDTVFLQEWDGPRQLLIYKHSLVGFENSLVPILLSSRE